MYFRRDREITGSWVRACLVPIRERHNILGRVHLVAAAEGAKDEHELADERLEDGVVPAMTVSTNIFKGWRTSWQKANPEQHCKMEPKLRRRMQEKNRTISLIKDKLPLTKHAKYAFQRNAAHIARKTIAYVSKRLYWRGKRVARPRPLEG